MLPDRKFMMCLNWYLLFRDDCVGYLFVSLQTVQTQCFQQSASAALTVIVLHVEG